MRILAKKIMMTTYLHKDEYVPMTIFHYEDPIVYKFEILENYSLCTLGFFRVAKPKLSKAHLNMYRIRELPIYKNMITFKTTDKVLTDQISTSLNCELDLTKYISIGRSVNVTAEIKGRGFTGAMVLHNFKGMPAQHGTTKSHRSLGSTGAKKVARVFPGKKMHGRMGGYNICMRNLTILYHDPIKKIIAIKGCTPGHYNSIARIQLI